MHKYTQFYTHAQDAYAHALYVQTHNIYKYTQTHVQTHTHTHTHTHTYKHTNEQNHLTISLSPAQVVPEVLLTGIQDHSGIKAGWIS